MFVLSSGYDAPEHWLDGKIPRGYESHPVVNVSWREAIKYCEWLSSKTNQLIMLPNEAQWEKTARGCLSSVTRAGEQKGGRTYPWGDHWDATQCNNAELGLNDTTPVGIFPDGISPYECLDMAGNVWEWTSTIYKDYPYRPDDGRENLIAGHEVLRVLRGGSFLNDQIYARCAYRNRLNPYDRRGGIGFRVIVDPNKG